MQGVIIKVLLSTNFSISKKIFPKLDVIFVVMKILLNLNFFIFFKELTAIKFLSFFKLIFFKRILLLKTFTLRPDFFIFL